MRIVFDTNILIQLITGPKDGTSLTAPDTGEVVYDTKRRAEALLDMVKNNDGVVVIPTPVLAEYLVGIERAQHQTHIDLIQQNASFELASFDEIAAIECALLPTLQELKQMLPSQSSNKVKFDRQIVAIAKSLNVDEVWTHDHGVYRTCRQQNITVKSLADIAPNAEQFSLSLETRKDMH